MRITVVSSHYPPTPGGVADYAQAWCLAMRELGHELTLITSATGAFEPGITVQPFPGKWSLAGARELRRMILDSQPDSVVVQYVPHAYGPRGSGLPVAAMLSRLARSIEAPVIINAHEIYGAWSESIRRAPWHIAQRMGAVLLVSSTAAFVVTVKRRQQDLQRLAFPWADRVHVIQIGPTVAAREGDPSWRERHDVPADAFLLTSFGLGHPTQEVGQLPLVLDTLSEAGIDARLVTAGRLKVEHSQATHLGYVTSKDAAQLLAAGDIFALPLSDGMSGRRSSAISALAMGATVATTAGPDTDFELFGSEGVALSPAGDAQGFADMVLGLALDEDARNRVNSAGRELFAANFAWPVVARAWEELLNRASPNENAQAHGGGQ
ncbi:glycosyltransferase family 4 protein [Pseudarthrobacter phenanthrenivorans]|uniref:glycosyltransferase family 4 protein n=1 Tax=Pseudarthrobacter phenanthrenivorans TaxID=361575 RepID=UPI002F35C39B